MSRLYPAVQQNDINTHFESYMSKLLKKKSEKPRAGARDRASRVSNPIQLNRLPNPKSLVVPYIKTEEKILHLSDEELLHKEVINNKMAQVEVTVRTVSARNRSRSNSVCTDKREPWAKLLQHRKSNEVLAAHNYDYGLGTIHFLSKELQHKLQTACPGDPSLQQIVNDIQHTLYRINPSISTKSDDENVIFPKDQCGDINLNSKLRRENPEKGPSKLSKVHQSIQTITIGDSEKNIEKIYEYDRPNKLENTSKDLEATINKIKAEKLELEHQLQIEREMAKILKHDVDEQLAEKNDKSTQIIQQLREEKDALEKQLKENQKVDCQELNTLIQKLRSDNANIEYENMSLKHEMTIMKLEKEKMVFLLESRDKQINALKNEIEAIQSLVCSQLFELKTSCYSPTISRTSLESKNWKPRMKFGKIKPIQDIYLNKIKSSYTSYAPETPSSTEMNDNRLCKKDTTSTFKSDYQDEFPQRDIPVSETQTKKEEDAKQIASDFTLASEAQDLLKDDLETNIKEMFEELKRQALVVTLSTPPPEQLKDTQSVDTHMS